MKKCRTVNGLIRSLKKGEPTQLLVWDIMTNHFDKDGAYLNMGGGSYVYVGKQNWEIIREHIVNSNGEYFRNIAKYQSFFRMRETG